MKKNIALLPILSVYLTFSFCGFFEKDTPVASVEGVKLSAEQVLLNDIARNDDGINTRELLKYLNSWVDKELLFQEAVKQNVTLLPRMEFELEQLRKSMIINIFIKERIDNIISISEEEIEQYYNDNPDEFMAASDYYRFEGIKTENENFADVLQRELNNKVSIVTLYDRNPDQCTILNPGRTYIAESILPPAVITELNKNTAKTRFLRFALENEILFVKLVDAIKQGEIKNLDFVRSEIHSKLLHKKKQDKYSELVSRLRKNNNFVINTNVLTDTTEVR